MAALFDCVVDDFNWQAAALICEFDCDFDWEFGVLGWELRWVFDRLSLNLSSPVPLFFFFFFLLDFPEIS